jgi:hypothetical protein
LDLDRRELCFQIWTGASCAFGFGPAQIAFEFWISDLDRRALRFWIWAGVGCAFVSGQARFAIAFLDLDGRGLRFGLQSYGSSTGRGVVDVLDLAW